MDSPLSDVRINFDQGGLLVLNLSIAFIMFGVALTLKKDNFVELFRNPRAAITGVVSQFLLLPFITFLLIWIIKPLPGIALGMILVASCPGGNVSNFFSMVGKGNVALSVSLTAIATLLASIMTPVNFEFWGGILPFTSDLLQSINLRFYDMLQTVALILALPLGLGLLFSNKFPKTTERIHKPIKIISFLILIGIIIIAFTNNFSLFLEYWHYVFALVLIHNAIAFATGYTFSRLMKNNAQDTRSITIETGIQNSGLGLVIIFTFLGGHGGMAIITAWWGIWHIISGFIVSRYFAYKTSSALVKA